MPYNPRQDDYQETGDLNVLIGLMSLILFSETRIQKQSSLLVLGGKNACFRDYYKENQPFSHICFHSHMSSLALHD